MQIVWDEPKRRANFAKHGFDFAQLDESFFEDAIVVNAHSGRFKAIGMIGSEKVSVIFAFLGAEAISVISLRPASQMERLSHEKQGRKAGPALDN